MSSVPSYFNLDDSSIDPYMFPHVSDPYDQSHTANSCNYFSEAKFNSTFSTLDQSFFSVLHMNVWSLSKHFDQLQTHLRALHSTFSIIGLSETWLKLTDIPANIYSLPGYYFESKNRHDRTGGGVAMYISTNVQYVVRHDLTRSTDSFESIFVEVDNYGSKNIIVGVIYKPPSVSFDNFCVNFQDALDIIAAENKSCLISGDFNINLLNVDHNSQCQEFVDLIFNHSCIPLINKPTRVTSTSATLLDNIFPISYPRLIPVF